MTILGFLLWALVVAVAVVIVSGAVSVAFLLVSSSLDTLRDSRKDQQR